MKDFTNFLLTEDWKRDSKARHVATNALITVLSTLKQVEQEDGNSNRLFIPRKIDGSVATSGAKLGLTGDGAKLIFVFALRDMEQNGSLGFFDEKPVFIINCLRRPFDTKNLYQLIPHDTFIHEYIHFLDWLESKGTLTGASEAQAANSNWTPIEAYVNNDAEFNGHYQEAVFKLQKTLFNMKAAQVQLLYRKGVKNFIEIMKASYFDSYIIDAMNSQYQAKLVAKLTELFNGFIPDVIQTLQDSERVAV